MRLPTDDVSQLSKRQRIGYSLILGFAWLQEQLYRYVMRDRVWRSSDGTVRPLRKMNDGHLRNSIRLMERRGDTRNEIFRHLLDESRRRREATHERPRTRPVA